MRANCPDCIESRAMTEEERDYFFQLQAGSTEEHTKRYQEFMQQGMFPEVAESTGYKGQVVTSVVVNLNPILFWGTLSPSAYGD